MEEFESVSDKNIPQVGMRFKNPEEAWSFWLVYGGCVGFDVRKRYTNISKYDSPVKEKEEDESNETEKDKDQDEDEDEETHLLTDFSACMYGYEDKAAFEEAFDAMRSKVHKQTWLDSIYKVKEKWVECYMRDVFSLRVRSTQLSESFNNALKNHLKSDFENALDCLSSQLEEKLNISTSAVNEPCKEQENIDPNMQQRDGMFAAAKLKKKEVQSKNSKRFRTWLDKLRKKGKRKATKSVAKTKKGAKKNDEVQPLVEVDGGGNNT